VAVTSVLASSAIAQVAPPCDAGLRRPAQSPYAYGPRTGDRCEGIYVKQVSGTALALASLTSGFEAYDLASVRTLTFRWSGPADSLIRIRVSGIQPNLYYGMDAAPAGTTRSYTWPASMIASLRIARGDIGALAWTRRKVGGISRNVYLPLAIDQGRPKPAAPGYTLVLFPGVKLREVYYTLAPADSLGRPREGGYVYDHKALGYGFYPAERPIRIKIPSLDPPGLYYVEVAAERPDSSPVGMDPILIDTSER
jgi:hypothetical protein